MRLDRKKLPQQLQHQARRVRARVRHRLRYPLPAIADLRPVFVMGVQRSGTQLLTQLLERSPEVWVHNHLKFDPIFGGRPDPAYPVRPNTSNAQLAPLDTLQRLIRSDRAPVVAFHALADSQHADLYLEHFPQGKVIWIWRHFEDVAASSVQKWGDHGKDVVRRFRDGEWHRLGWRGERVGRPLVDEVLSAYHDGLSPHDGAALLWFLRNRVLEAQGLIGHPRVRLVDYAALVARPVAEAGAVFAWAGASFQPWMVAHVRTSSVGKGRSSVTDPGVLALCRPLLDRLRAATGGQP